MTRGVRYPIGVAILIVVTAGSAACAAPSARVQSGPTDHTAHAAPNNETLVPLREGERFVQLSIPRPYTPQPPNGGTDEYRCFLVDPKLTDRAFVTGSQFLPQNADIVHHAIFFRVDPEDVADAQRLDAEAPGDGWTCFGGTGIGAGRGPGRQLSTGAAWIGAWAPGGKEAVIGNKTGFELRPGTQIAVQVHYNLLHSGGKAAGPDQSGVRLRVMPGTANLAPLQVTLLPAPVELPCAAGEVGTLCDRESAVLDVWRRFGPQAGATVAGLNMLCNAGKPPKAGSTQHCDIRVRQAGTLYSVAGHMHLLGRSIKVELNPETAQAKTLLDVPVYDFDQQGARPLASPVKVNAGDMYRVTCTHDATLRSKLPQLQPLAPRYVVWGEGTSDEMCLGIVVWAKPA